MAAAEYAALQEEYPEPIHHSPGGIRIIVPLNGPGAQRFPLGLLRRINYVDL